MEKSEKVRYEMLLRVRDFGKAHVELFPESSKAGKAFAQVAEAAARIDANAMTKPVAARDGRTAKTAARTAVREAMLIIAHTARGLATEAPEGKDRLRMPKGKDEQEVLRAARSFISDGEAVREQLLGLGLPPTCLDTLREAADRFEQAIAGRRTGRRTVAKAQEGIDTGMTLGLEAVRQLDILVPNLLIDQPELLAGWRRDRKVVAWRRKGKVVTAARPALAEEPAAGEPGVSEAPAGEATPPTDPAEPLRRAS